MPPTPTARRKRVGIELRKMREAAGRTAGDASAVLGVDRSKVTLIEQGNYPISAERVITLADEYEEGDAEYVDAVAAMASDRSKGWWEERRGLVPAGILEISELEHYAHGLVTYQICHVPGLMQTEDTAREIFREVYPPLRPLSVEARVENRVRRSKILSHSDRTYEAIVHESALRMEFGGTGVARAQLKHMLTLTEQPNITLRVLEFRSGGFKGAGHAVMYARGPVPRLDTVQLDSVGSPMFLTEVTQLENYRHIIGAMRDRALGPTESRDFISGILKDK
ncbi:helix-turn-helix transcriptional regulator [Streptomyces sp. TLI_053]|uniref:helix-turn-helix domain-containing protein n=1 Tax=Streptomyces sp. TLI_053 TaxID=1855352 RepID=UPI000B88D226|nr:helix-turn-helix transcriptional regulator [Streptomyces sp. TLI_053]